MGAFSTEMSSGPSSIRLGRVTYAQCPQFYRAQLAGTCGDKGLAALGVGEKVMDDADMLQHGALGAASAAGCEDDVAHVGRAGSHANRACWLLSQCRSITVHLQQSSVPSAKSLPSPLVHQA